MSAEVFVDTNVLVYQFDESEPGKRELAVRWMRTLWDRRAGRISIQVLQEFYNTVTRKISDPLPPESARDAVRELGRWKPLIPDQSLFEEAFRIEDRYGLAWWDALIVAAGRSSGCAYLLTEDLQHGQDFEGLQVVDFQLVTAEELLSD